MTAKEGLQAITATLKAFFADETLPAAPPTSDMTPGKLSDGTVISYTKLDAGGDLYILTAEGTNTPAPVGEYETETGDLISVTEVGKIASVTPSGLAPSSTEMTTEQLAATLRAEFAAAIARETELIATQVAQAAVIISLQNELAAFKKATGTVLAQFSSTLEIVANAENAAPIITPRNTVFTKQPESIQAGKEKAMKAFSDFAKAVKEKNN